MPSQCHITIPRQYMGPGGRVLRSGNSARKAMSEEFVRDAMLPGERRSEKPEAAERRSRISNRKPVFIRGKKKKHKNNEGRRLSEEFASRTYRRPERAG